MDIKMQADAARLLNAYIGRKSYVRQLVKNTPRPPSPEEHIQSSPLCRCTPEEQGISSSYIRRFYAELSAQSTLNMHTVTVARNGCIISQGAYYPYTPDIPQVSHSLCKSVTCLVVGLLVCDGLLSVEDRLVDIFAKRVKPVERVTLGGIRIKHLLTMSTGMQFNEAGAVTQTDWVRSYLESIPKFAAGSSFEYNSMNTYMLAAAVREITGKPLSQLAAERIFEPLGIGDAYWECCPLGIEKGGWGLYIYPEDALKLGQLIIQNGIWEGKRILSAEWIRQATSVQIKTPKITGDYDYGYQMWLAPGDGDEILFNGMFGQNLHIFRKTRTLVMTTAGNGDIFQRCSVYRIIKKYFGKRFVPNSRLPENGEEYEALCREQSKLCMSLSPYKKLLAGEKTEKLPSLCVATAGRSYAITEAESYGVGVFPTVAQGIHNNFTKGLTRLDTSVDGDGYYITFTEHEETHRLRVGFDEAYEQIIKLGDEVFRACVYGDFTTDEDDNPVLKLTISYLEIANHRSLKIYFYDKKLLIKCDETPGYEFAEFMVNMILRDSANDALVEALAKKIKTDLLFNKLANFLKPSVRGTLIRDRIM